MLGKMGKRMFSGSELLHKVTNGAEPAAVSSSALGEKAALFGAREARSGNKKAVSGNIALSRRYLSC